MFRLSEFPSTWSTRATLEGKTEGNPTVTCSYLYLYPLDRHSQLMPEGDGCHHLIPGGVAHTDEWKRVSSSKCLAGILLDTSAMLSHVTGCMETLSAGRNPLLYLLFKAVVRDLHAEIVPPAYIWRTTKQWHCSINLVISWCWNVLCLAMIHSLCSLGHDAKPSYNAVFSVRFGCSILRSCSSFMYLRLRANVLP